MARMTASRARAAGKSESVILNGESVRAMRHCLHELANVFTGVMIGSGLLSQFLEGGSLEHYAGDIGELSERGSGLVREIRGHLLAACGDAESRRDGSSVDLEQGQ